MIFELYYIKNELEKTKNVSDQHPDSVKEFDIPFIYAYKEFSVTPLFRKDENGIRNLKNKKSQQLRKVSYQNMKKRYFEFLGNCFIIVAKEVAFLYKKIWGIKLLFKKMKQSFQLYYLYGENENAIYTQVWCTFIDQLLFTMKQKISQTKKTFSVVASLVRINLISSLDIYELLRSTKRTYMTRDLGPP